MARRLHMRQPMMSAPSTDDRIGMLLPGDIELIRPIGSGSCGVVYLGRQRLIGRSVAVKFIHSHFPESHPLQTRFRREARAMSKLSHPNSVRVLLTGERGSPYLVMEYVDGPTLATLQRERPLPPTEVIQYGMQLFAALDEAHAYGILHRDIKPGNILVDQRSANPMAKLGDFGLALIPELSRVTTQGLAIGSPRYMAPEQARGEALHGAADVFSLALVLAEAAFGSSILTSKGPREPLIVRGTEPFASLVRVGQKAPELARLLDRALAFDPRARPSASEMVEQLSALVQERRTSYARLRTVGVDATSETVTEPANVVATPAPKPPAAKQELTMPRPTPLPTGRSLFEETSPPPSLELLPGLNWIERHRGDTTPKLDHALGDVARSHGIVVEAATDPWLVGLPYYGLASIMLAWNGGNHWDHATIEAKRELLRARPRANVLEQLVQHCVALDRFRALAVIVDERVDEASRDLLLEALDATRLTIVYKASDPYQPKKGWPTPATMHLEQGRPLRGYNEHQDDARLVIAAISTLGIATPDDLIAATKLPKTTITSVIHSLLRHDLAKQLISGVMLGTSEAAHTVRARRTSNQVEVAAARWALAHHRCAPDEVVAHWEELARAPS